MLSFGPTHLTTEITDRAWLPRIWFLVCLKCNSSRPLMNSEIKSEG